MRISDGEIKKLLNKSGIGDEVHQLLQNKEQLEQDRPIIRLITRQVIDMPDRDDVVADLKRRIEAGEYNPTGDEIAEAMIRRNIADRAR